MKKKWYIVYSGCALAILLVVRYHYAQSGVSDTPFISSLESYKTIFEVNVVCSALSKPNMSDYQPKNFQKTYMTQYPGESGSTCFILPGFVDLADAQIASGSLLLHYASADTSKKTESTQDSTPRSDTHVILMAKAVCAPGAVNLTEEQARKLLPGSLIAGKPFEIADKKTGKPHTCFLLTVLHKNTTPTQVKKAAQYIDSTLNPAFDVGITLNK